MALQIETPETIRLIEEVSRRTGEQPETAVQVAMQERLARLRTPEEEAQRRAEIYALVHELRSLVKQSPGPIQDPGELLYGDDGLPK
jgi:hypothetical protein